MKKKNLVCIQKKLMNTFPFESSWYSSVNIISFCEDACGSLFHIITFLFFVDEVKRWCTDEPQLSGFLDYADFFSGLNFVINIYWSWPRSVAIFLSLKKKKKKKNSNEKWSKGKFALLITLNAHMMFFFETSWLTSTFQHFRPIFMNFYCK